MVILVCLLITGLVAGLLGGFLGIGGSIIIIPVLTEFFGLRQHVFQAAALIINFFVAVPALRQHLSAHALHGPTLRWLVPSAVAAAVLGVACSEWRLFQGAGSAYLTGMFGVFLLAIACRDAWILWRGATESSHEASVESKPSGWRIGLLIGLPTGFISGLLGVGGGVLAVPLQQRICKLSVRTAIANSAATIVGLSVVGAAFKHYALAIRHPDIDWHEPFRLALVLIPTAVIGATAGGRLTHILPVRFVRLAFMILLMLAGARMVSRAWMAVVGG